MIKLTRNKMMAELVLSGHTMVDVAKAFDTHPTIVRKVVQTIIDKAVIGAPPIFNGQDSTARAARISIVKAREKADQLLPLVRTVDSEDFLWRKCPGNTNTFKAKNIKIV